MQYFEISSYPLNNRDMQVHRIFIHDVDPVGGHHLTELWQQFSEQLGSLEDTL